MCEKALLFRGLWLTVKSPHHQHSKPVWVSAMILGWGEGNLTLIVGISLEFKAEEPIWEFDTESFFFLTVKKLPFRLQDDIPNTKPEAK